MKPFLTAWLANLAAVLEKLAGARPRIQPAVSVDAKSVPLDLTWWEPELGSAGLSAWIGTEASTRQALGYATGASPLGDEGGREAEQGYQTLLQRSWQGVEGAVGRGRSTMPPPNAQVSRIEVEIPGAPAVYLFAVSRDERKETRTAKADPSQRARGGTTLDLLLDTEIPFTVRFGSARMLLQDIVRLSPGSVVDLNRGMDEPVDIIVNGHLAARGDVVSVQGNYALRITEIHESRKPPQCSGVSTVESSKEGR